jgi:hypothetical protein
MPTVIARYGPEGDYISGMQFVNDYPQLKVAEHFAQQKGLLPCHSPQNKSNNSQNG